MIVVLHTIRSAHNVGSIFRTADACGAEKIYPVGYTPCPTDRFGRENGTLVKVALGAERYIPWERIISPARLVKRLKAKHPGYAVLAIEQSKTSRPYTAVSATALRSGKFILIVGNEITGLPKSVLAACDMVLEIPMYGKKESLNVAVAFGIVAFHFVHKGRGII